MDKLILPPKCIEKSPCRAWTFFTSFHGNKIVDAVRQITNIHTSLLILQPIGWIRWGRECGEWPIMFHASLLDILHYGIKAPSRSHN